mmetsp:Transcript_20351/g.29969  ORF Transcript_20351/g.29969 Transcript_20351/m.29969 type:complete len:495 (-) Transcript_20351:177-1661(-)
MRLQFAPFVLSILATTTAFTPAPQQPILQKNNNRLSSTTTVQLHAQKRNNLEEIITNLNDATRKTITTLSLSAALFLAPTISDVTTLDDISSVPPQITLSTLVRPPTANAASYNDFTPEQRVVAEAWRIVDNSYLDRTFNNQDWFKLRQDNVKRKYKSMDEAHAAIEKMVSTLGDKYTRYLSPAKYQSLVDSATGNLCGVGVEIATTRDGARVIASDVEPNSPASNGGILPKDVFLEVDGVRFDTDKATPDDVAGRLRGREGSRVGVVMERDGKVLDFILTRQPITITSVRTYMSDKAGGGVGKVGVIKIKSFSGTTASFVKDALVDLKKKGAQAFVLDLRNNPGGLLPGGVDTASLFLQQNKPVVYTVNKSGAVDTFSSLADGIELDAPLVIFVNGNTASAAEVLTAALKENNRATVVGEKTFGKGVVQTIRSLSNDNGGVAVTIQRYETPLRNNINKLGIEVDAPPTALDCDNADAVACIPSSAFKKPVTES